MTTPAYELPSIVSAGVPSGLTGPPGYERLESDVDWDPKYIEITPPERVIMLDELGPDAAGPEAFSPVGVTTPFKFLSDEGVRICDEICSELEQYAETNERIAKSSGGGGYRSRFLWGVATDPTLIAFFRELAQAPLLVHPVHHGGGVHINYAPDDLSRSVDLWHTDITSFDYVLMVTDPNQIKGGRFEWYYGPAEEGKALIEGGQPLPADKVMAAAFPGAGWAVLQQGHRILHRATKLEERGRRITLVGSFFTPHLTLSDPTSRTLLTRRRANEEIALVEGARFRAVEAAHRLLMVAEQKADFSTPLPELQQALRDAIAGVEDFIEEFDREPPALTPPESPELIRKQRELEQAAKT